MDRKSRYQDYLNGMKDKAQNGESMHSRGPTQETDTHSSPQSILAKLKALNGQGAVVCVPIGGVNE